MMNCFTENRIFADSLSASSQKINAPLWTSMKMPTEHCGVKDGRQSYEVAMAGCNKVHKGQMI